MVEFLISVPFMLLLLAAVVEFGIMFYTHTALNKSVQNAARYMSDHAIRNAGLSEIRAQDEINAKNLAVYGSIKAEGRQSLIDGFDTSMVTLDCAYGFTGVIGDKKCKNDPVATGMSAIIVTAGFPYTPVLGGMLGTDVSITLRASTYHSTW